MEIPGRSGRRTSVDSTQEVRYDRESMLRTDCFLNHMLRTAEEFSGCVDRTDLRRSTIPRIKKEMAESQHKL